MRAMTTAKTVKYPKARAHLISLRGKVNAHHAVFLGARPYTTACRRARSEVRQRRKNEQRGGWGGKGVALIIGST